MTQILILYAHPAQQFSRMNRLLAEVAQRHASVFFNDLYHHYPNFLVDIEREQHLLQTHHTIVFQHPLYWYSTPAILKEWQDIVLQPGFAYGEGGEYLRGKRFTSAITVGGAESEYAVGGHNKNSILDFLLPIRQTMLTCGMSLIDPFVSYGVHYNANSTVKHSELDRFSDWLNKLGHTEMTAADLATDDMLRLP